MMTSEYDPKLAYNRRFYEAQQSGSSRSASIVVPLLLRYIAAQSVVDVGCGVGTWAAQFVASGVKEVVGIDGDYIDRSMLMIDAERFIPHNLNEPIRLSRQFDLAVCLEVAERAFDLLIFIEPPSKSELEFLTEAAA